MDVSLMMIKLSFTSRRTEACSGGRYNSKISKTKTPTIPYFCEPIFGNKYRLWSDGVVSVGLHMVGGWVGR